VDDTIQYMTRFQHEQRRGASARVAADRALRRVGAVLIVSSVIMLCGFASLLWCSLPPIRLFGALSCVLILTALAGDALLLPAMVRMFCGELQTAANGSRAPAAVAVAPAGTAVAGTAVADSFRMGGRKQPMQHVTSIESHR
jgi:predicted exporter